jgi:hypothetical protein
VGGEVKQEKLLDQYGNAVETLNYLRRGTGAINEAIIGCSFRPGNIAVVKFERFDSGPQNGFDKKLTFWAAGGVTPAPNANFAYGLAFEYDDAGEMSRVTTLDATGLPTTSRQGFATKVRKVSPLRSAKRILIRSAKRSMRTRGSIERLSPWISMVQRQVPPILIKKTSQLIVLKGSIGPELIGVRAARKGLCITLI